MPLLGCATSVTIMIGLLGFIGWKVTVISSNFIALMLILNMAMNIHITVRFLQLKKELPNLSKEENVLLLVHFCQTVARLNQWNLKENEFGIEDTCPRGWHE